MKQGVIMVRGKERIIQYEVLKKINLVYANIIDTKGRRHLMMRNDRGRFTGAWSTRDFPDDLLDALNEFLQSQEPVVVTGGFLGGMENK